MPKILAEKGPDRGRSWTVKSDGTFLIGRDSSSQISLRDEEISRRHYSLIFVDLVDGGVVAAFRSHQQRRIA